MKKNILLLWTVIFPLDRMAQAQTDSNLINPGVVIQHIKEDGNYLRPLVIFETLTQRYLQSNFKQSYLNWIAYAQTFVGDYAHAIQNIDSLLSKHENYSKPDLDTLKPVDAYELF